MATIKQYIIALTNLYGALRKEKVLEIYNLQNEDQLTMDDLNIFLDEKEDELVDNFVYPEGCFFVHQAIASTDSLEDMIREKADKPYYIPKKDKLLNYTDDNYFEKTEEYYDLLQYINKYLIKDLKEAKKLSEEIHGMCQFGIGLQQIYEILNKRNISFEDSEKVNIFLMKVSTMSNNIRIWENNGFTPNELYEQYDN